MKTKVITLALIGIIFYACSENSSEINELDIPTEQNDIDKNIETITEQEGWMETITEKDKFYKYKQVIEKLKKSNEQNNIDIENIVLEEGIETITEQENWIETITEEDDFYKYKQVIEKLKNAKEQNSINKKKVILEEKDIEIITEQL
jgi:hypothetical protein